MNPFGSDQSDFSASGSQRNWNGHYPNVRQQPPSYRHTQRDRVSNRRFDRICKRPEESEAAVSTDKYKQEDGSGSKDVFHVNWIKYQNASLAAIWSIEKKIGHYSLDGQFKVRWDTSGLKYFAPEKLSSSVDLFQGFNEEEYDRREQLQKKYKQSYSIAQLVEWLRLNKDNGVLPVEQHFDFAIKHHFLKTIVMSAFGNHNWAMEAVVNNGVIYLHNSLGAGGYEHFTQRSHDNMRKKGSYGGLRFEKIAVKVQTENPSERFYSVLHGKLYQSSEVKHKKNPDQAPLNFLLSAKIDAVTGSTPSASEDLSNYVEMKTAHFAHWIPHTSVHNWKPHFTQAMHWWTHCYFAGIPRLFIGLRCNGSLVKTILTASHAFPGIQAIQIKQQPCIDFCFALFSWIKSVVKDESTVYEFRRDGNVVRCSESQDPTHKFLEIFREN